MSDVEEDAEPERAAVRLASPGAAALDPDLAAGASDAEFSVPGCERPVDFEDPVEDQLGRLERTRVTFASIKFTFTTAV